MCGRYMLFVSPEELETRFDATPTHLLSARHNCASGQELPVVANDVPEEFRFLKWGLIPSWVDGASVSSNRINAHAETIREKRNFADAYEVRRRPVPSNGSYEWVDRGGCKQPYRVAFEDDRPFAMAGLQERWTASTKQTGLGDFGSDGPSREQEPLETLTVVTTGPNDLVSELHHRMAVVLVPENEQTWLHGDPDEAAVLLDTYPDNELAAYPVSTWLNSPANDGPDLIE